jgi:hypothetical protein
MHYFDKDRLMCMAKFLFDVEQRNRLAQKGLLKRFTTTCTGKQPTMEEMRAEKAVKYKELDRNSEEYEEWFLKYSPSEKKGKKNDKGKGKGTGKGLGNGKGKGQSAAVKETDENGSKKKEDKGFFGLW